MDWKGLLPFLFYGPKILYERENKCRVSKLGATNMLMNSCKWLVFVCLFFCSMDYIYNLDVGHVFG